MSVTILLSTFNGALHLGPLFDSLLAQSHAGWRLVVRDDGSTDATPDVIAGWAADHPGRVTILSGGGERVGAARSFGRLLEAVDDDHVMFCDQDDVWLPEKIAVTLKAMAGEEETGGSRIPLLVHTDLRVVDAELRLLAPSLWRYQKTDPFRGGTLNRLLVQNCVTGCTTMVNRALRERALPLPAEAIMHDWWLGIVAAACGRIVPLAEPTVLYRQHGGNDTGARGFSLGALVRCLRSEETRQMVGRKRGQAAAFYRRYGDLLTDSDRETVEAYLQLGEAGFFRRRHLILKHGFYYSGLARNVANLAAGWG